MRRTRSGYPLSAMTFISSVLTRSTIGCRIHAVTTPTLVYLAHTRARTCVASEYRRFERRVSAAIAGEGDGVRVDSASVDPELIFGPLLGPLAWWLLVVAFASVVL